MNITYLIGNGFDLNLGLDTRYSDFYDYYLEQPDPEKPNLKKLRQSISSYCDKNNILEEIINWSDAELGLGQFTNEFVDVANGDGQIAECHRDICEALSKYLIDQQDRFASSLLEADKKVIAAASNAFSNYTKGLRQNDINTINNLVSGVSGGLKISIIDFNYTDTVDRLVVALKRENHFGERIWSGTRYPNELTDVMHIHGTVTHGMVFGVNDDSQLNSCVFRDEEPEWKGQLIKSQFLENMGENSEQNFKEILQKSHIIYIFGMSLGKTDKRIWNQIISLMKTNNNTVLIIFDREAPIIRLGAESYLRYCRIKKKEFLQYADDLDTKNEERVFKRIFISNENIFKCLSGIVNKPNSINKE